MPETANQTRWRICRACIADEFRRHFDTIDLFSTGEMAQMMKELRTRHDEELAAGYAQNRPWRNVRFGTGQTIMACPWCCYIAEHVALAGQCVHVHPDDAPPW